MRYIGDDQLMFDWSDKARSMNCHSLLHQYFWKYNTYNSLGKITDNVCRRDEYVQMLAENAKRPLSYKCMN